MEELVNDVTPCQNREECELINELLQRGLTKQETYFNYKRDVEREILSNEERIFELYEEIQDLLQANRNGRSLIDGMLNNIFNNGSKEE